MHRFPLLLLPLALGACSSMPGLDNPRVTLSPQYTLYRAAGGASRQSLVGGVAVDRPRQSTHHLGMAQREEDVGGTLHVGDGFSGAEVSYLRVEMKSPHPGAIATGFGVLNDSDTVHGKLFLDEWKLGYLAQVVSLEPREDLRFQLGAGLALYHRELKLRVREITGAREQGITMDDPGLPYAAARGRATWGRVFGQADYAINPDLAWGGEFDGVQHDLELRIGVTFPDQEVALFGGWRYDTLKGNGSEQGQRFDVDLRLEGYFLGGSLTF